MWRALGKLARDTQGAVAPTVALSLFALIAAGGIAFDYARLAALDTELQNAADQAALAAASQLDGRAGACAARPARPRTCSSIKALMANDGSCDRRIVVADEAGLRCNRQDPFLPGQGQDQPPRRATPTPSSSRSRSIRAPPYYALTPIVGAHFVRAQSARSPSPGFDRRSARCRR